MHPFERDYDRFEILLTEKHCEELKQKGFVVIDNFFGHGWASAMLEEMQWLNENNLFKPNKTQFTLTQSNTQKNYQFVKPNIYEVDLHDNDLRRKVPELDSLFHSQDLINVLSKYMPELDLNMSTSGRTLKLQRNAGNGGCFPCHYDNPGRPSKRKLTCLLYLNEKWQNGDGGEVQLLPFLQQPVTIAPKMDRLVIFMSDRILHRVLPSSVERYCLTIWLDGDKVNSDADTQLRITPNDMADWFGFLDRLRKSPVQRLLSRGVYEEEYYESLTQCMLNADGFVEMMKSHETHLENLMQNKPLYSFISRLRQYREMNDETPICMN
jgi:Rps23 Pro-64 3,4-dihydroxylase Tpa1-like proline 4-hydroxylase